jgi:sugar phosphate isomerase/epimerase
MERTHSDYFAHPVYPVQNLTHKGMSMKLSCLPVSFYGDIIEGRMRLRDWARMGAELALDAVDVTILFFPDHSPQALARARREVEDEGMSLTMMSTYPDFTHPDSAERTRELEREREAVDVGAALGVKYVRAIAGQAHPETGREQGIAWAVEGLHKLVEATRGSGVTVVYENHDQASVMQYQDFSARQEIFLAICEGTADIGLAINYDTANATALTPDPLALLERVIQRVVTVHAADTRRIEGRYRPSIVGAGEAPIPAIFRRLRQTGWDNWVCIEEASKQGRAGVEEAVRFVRRTWEEAQPK